MQVPRPETLVQRTAEVLREQMAQGRFGDALPGEPRLANDLLVSRGTLRKALAILAREGVISEGSPGKPRRVRVSARASGIDQGRQRFRVGVLALRSLDALSTSTQQFLRQLAAETEPDGVSYSYHHSVATQQKRPAKRLDALLAEDPADLWLLYEATVPVARFFKSRGAPALICGGPALDEGVAYCGFDGAAALRHAFGTLFREGHRNIIMPSRYDRPIRKQTMREAFERRGILFDPAVHMPLWNSELDQLRDLLRHRLDAPDHPTAIILNGLNALIALHSCMMERRLRIPGDLSVLSIGSDPMLECFHPAIGHYQTPYRPLARLTAEMIRSLLAAPSSPPAIKLLQTDYVPGGSVSSPADQR